MKHFQVDSWWQSLQSLMKPWLLGEKSGLQALLAQCIVAEGQFCCASIRRIHLVIYIVPDGTGRCFDETAVVRIILIFRP